MYKICQTEESQKRQYSIESALLQMMVRMPYAEITVSSLCAEASIPRKTFYRYFEKKDDVLFALIDHTQMLYLAAGPAGPSSFAEAERMYSFWYEHRELLDVLIKNDMEGIWYSRMIETAVGERVGARFSQQKEDVYGYQLMTHFVIGGLLSCVLFWHRGGWRYTPEQMAEITGKLLTEPLYNL